MVTKRLLCPQRARRVPRQFSWVDQRLIFDGHFEHCSAAAWGLYLLLVVVGDSQGLSYYSDRSICRSLSLSLETLEPLREELKAAGVIVYRKPLSAESMWLRDTEKSATVPERTPLRRPPAAIRNNLGRLRTPGFVHYPSPRRVVVTQHHTRYRLLTRKLGDGRLPRPTFCWSWQSLVRRLAVSVLGRLRRLSRRVLGARESANQEQGA